MYDTFYGTVVFRLKSCLSWPGNMNALRTILLYHFSNGVFIGGGLETGVTNLLKSLQGNNLRVLHVSPNLSTLNRAVNIRHHGIMAATKSSLKRLYNVFTVNQETLILIHSVLLTTAILCHRQCQQTFKLGVMAKFDFLEHIYNT